MATPMPVPGASQQVQADEHVFLNGRPPLGEFIAFMEAQTIEGPTTNRATLADQWRAANDHIRELEQKEGGWADAHAVAQLPDSLLALRDQVLQDPITVNAFGTVPIEIAMVELDRMVVFQKHINIEYARQLSGALGPDPSDEDLFRFCLPFDRRYDPPVRSAQIGPNVWAFVSPSQDFRPLQPVVLDPGDVRGLTSTGAPVAIVGLMVGYGSNYLNAIRAGGRLVLNNGSHRAYALRDSGVTHAPCLIQNVSRPEELEMVGSEDLVQNAQRYLEAPRPPVLRDYFDPRLRMAVHVPRQAAQVRVAVNSEKAVAPAA